MKTYIDPPSGWMYGFPKVLPDPPPDDINEWLIENGYPREQIEMWGGNMPCGHFTKED